jgi:nucleoporin POM152
MPFTVFYTFNGKQQKAQSPGTTFRRLAELPGTFTISGLKDSASDCLAPTSPENPVLTKIIHPIPSVRLSKGRESHVDIHEGGDSELLFEFTGTAPFEFTYTRSTNAKKGVKSKVLEIRTELSQEHSMRIRTSEAGTYEVISIKDRWCSYAVATEGTAAGRGQKLLTY